MAKETTPIPMLTINKLTKALTVISELMASGKVAPTTKFTLVEMITNNILEETAPEIERIKAYAMAA